MFRFIEPSSGNTLTTYTIELGIHIDPYLFTRLVYAQVVFCLECIEQVFELIKS
jgi:hypothetical protein